VKGIPTKDNKIFGFFDGVGISSGFTFFKEYFQS
tara:strand:- start:411 stop:512 length:102 start_codon:yes stop_codon:yes gene_type:complete